MKIYFFNDTSIGHSGSRAATLALRSILSDHEIIDVHLVGETHLSRQSLTESDIVLVNGEGTIHHTESNPRARFLLNTLRNAQCIGKKTLLVNSLLSNVDQSYKDVFERLDLLSVREPHSEKEGLRLGGKPVILADSCLNFALQNEGKPFADVSGLILRGFTHSDARYADALEGLDYPRLGLHSNFDDLMATLRNATAYMTGQHHGLYAAGIANCPAIAVPSNTHKIGALIKWSGFKIPIAKTKSEVQEHIKKIRKNLSAYRVEFTKFHKWMINLPTLTADHINQALSS